MKKETAEKATQLCTDIQKLEGERKKVIKSAYIVINAIFYNDCKESISHNVHISDTEGRKIRQYIINMFEEEIKEKEKNLKTYNYKQLKQKYNETADTISH